MINKHKLDLRLQSITPQIWKEIAAIDELKGARDISLFAEWILKSKKSDFRMPMDEEGAYDLDKAYLKSCP